MSSFLCYPNMPTGAVADLYFFERVIHFARKHNLLVCLDAAYSEIYFDGKPTHSLLQVPGAKDVAIEMYSLSKTYNMTGWRIAFAVGNAEALAALGKLKSNVDSGAFMAIQRAATAALSGPQDCVAELRRIYQRRRDLLVDGFNNIGWKVPKSPATFYVWAPVPDGSTSEQFAKDMLSKGGILLTPGSAYGSQGEGYVRMSLTIQGECKEERLVEASQRVRDRVFSV